MDFKWLGHASVKITGQKVIYIDPFQINEGEKADIVLITHPHYDHCSSNDISKILKQGTVIITVADSQSKLTKLERPLTLVKPGDKLNVNGVKIEAVPAYNMGKHFHAKENQWVGYVVEANKKRYYHAGDTDLIPEMAQLKNIDVAFLPVGGTYTMNADEAAKAAGIINPKIAVPIHYGNVVGSKEDAERFKKLASCEVVL